MDDVLQIRDIAPPIESLSSGSAWIWIAIVAAALLFRLLRQKTPAAPEEAGDVQPPEPTARDKALKALDSLTAEQLIESGRTRLYFTKLNRILRQFLSEQFHCPSLLQTTTEMLSSDISSSLDDKESRQLFESFLRDSDLFKFADIKARSEIALAAHGTCRSLVKSLAKEGSDAL